MRETLAKIKESALAQINESNADLEQIKIKYLGKKGELTAVLRGMGALSPEERPLVGQLANEVRAQIEEAIAEKACKLQSGARGLRAITEGIMTKFMYEVPSDEKIKTLNITKEMVE